MNNRPDRVHRKPSPSLSGGLGFFTAAKNTASHGLHGQQTGHLRVLMFGGAFLLHRANYVLVLIREKTMLPFLFYVLFISTNPDFFPLKSTSVGVFCLILAIYQLFTTYHDPGAREKAGSIRDWLES
jgi:hypothetical protein